MPLSQKRINSRIIREIYKKNTDSMEYVWSWTNAFYSGLWLAILLVIKLVMKRGPPPPPPPLPSKGVTEKELNDSMNYTFVPNRNNTQFPPPFESSNDFVIGSMNQILESICTILIIATAVAGARKIPGIFRQLHHLDENIDTEASFLLGSRERKNLSRNGMIFSICNVIVCSFYTITSTAVSFYSALNHGAETKSLLVFIFQDMVKFGNAAVEAQFLNLCFFLNQRFALLNYTLKQLQRDVSNTVTCLRAKTIFENWTVTPSALHPFDSMDTGRIVQYGPLKTSDQRKRRTNQHTRGITTIAPKLVCISNKSLADTLGHLCRWHRRLCDIIDMVTSCYEIPLVVGITYCFTNCVFGIYSTIMRYGDHHVLLDKLPGLIWTLCYSCRLFTISIIPSVTVTQARKTRILVERLNNRSLDDSSKEEIAIFISHLSSRNISFSVCGFFTLNILFLRSIAVAIVTYVILLMQFKLPNTSH